MLDVGTDNAALLADPLYTGLRQPRLRGEEYSALVDEFVTALEVTFPGVLIQFEDFATTNAFGLLARYRERVCTYNDDIQGTAAVTLAALLLSGRVTGRRPIDERLLFAGAGAAATGIADLAVKALHRAGLDRGEAERRIWMFDVDGLLVRGRRGLREAQRPFAHEHPPTTLLPDAIRSLRPTALIGLTGQPQLFTEPVLRAMGEANERPVIFALSNPTSRAECTAEQAYRGTGGRAVYSSGSPCAPVEVGGRRFSPSQTNNAYVFPGVGLGVTATGARRVTDEMLLAAAEALAEQADETMLRMGALLPPLERIREVSLRIARAVAQVVIDGGLAGRETPSQLEPYLRDRMYRPDYRPYV
jgi:malate dehydrogenase (oxaloacetate-decarboxylating)(NADP+)